MRLKRKGEYEKNTVTKMLAVAVTIAMLGGLTACGSSSKEPASGSAAATGEATQAEAEENRRGCDRNR